MKKGLFALALGTFTLGMTEFIIEGILTDVAHDMNVSIPQVGHLISIYALGVCAGAFSLILMHRCSQDSQRGQGYKCGCYDVCWYALCQFDGRAIGYILES